MALGKSVTVCQHLDPNSAQNWFRQISAKVFPFFRVPSVRPQRKIKSDKDSKNKAEPLHSGAQINEILMGLIGAKILALPDSGIC